jgi:hypothetical protein
LSVSYMSDRLSWVVSGQVGGPPVVGEDGRGHHADRRAALGGGALA